MIKIERIFELDMKIKALRWTLRSVILSTSTTVYSSSKHPVRFDILCHG